MDECNNGLEVHACGHACVHTPRTRTVGVGISGVAKLRSEIYRGITFGSTLLYHVRAWVRAGVSAVRIAHAALDCRSV